MDTKNKLPIICPLTIQTKGLPWHKALYTWLTKARDWELVETWHFEWDGLVWVIPKGFVFDGASVPRSFWWAFSPTGILLMPGIIHDYIYRYGSIKTTDGVQIFFTRAAADRVFRDIAIHVNGFRLINWIPYLILVLFGWIAWMEHKKKRR